MITRVGHDEAQAGPARANRRFVCRLAVAALAALLLGAASTFAQGGTGGPTTPAPQDPLADSRSVPVAELVAEADDVERDLRDTDERLTVDASTVAIEESLPGLTDEITARLDETARLLQANPSLDTLRETEARWNEIGERLSVWQRDLAARAARLESEIGRLSRLEEVWAQTLRASQASEAPAEILARAEAVLSSARRTRAAVEETRGGLLALQSRVGEQQTRVRDAADSVRRVREAAVGRLLVKDSPALWSDRVRSYSPTELASAIRDAWSSHVTTLTVYARGHVDAFVLHGVVFAALLAALRLARRRVRPWVKKEPHLQRAAHIFERPTMAAIVLSVLATGWAYAEAPRVLSAALGMLLLVPTVVLLRGLVDRSLRVALVVLTAVFLVDIVEGLSEGVPLVSRLLLLGESAVVALFLAWALARRDGNDEELPRRRAGLRIAAFAALAVFLVAILANTLGYVTLARLVVGAGLESAFVGVLLYATVRILDGLAMFALRVRPLSSLRMVASHRRLLRSRFVRALRWAAGALWLVVTLERFEVREPVFAAAGSTLSASLSVGAIHISLGDVLLFVASVWGAFLLSRFLRFVLDEDVYPRAELGRGIPYAVSTVVHYAVLVAGLLFALGAVGVDMTRFTILASAFGVGLGFGLQNIFNHFASGLILLVERPVKVGDVVEVEGQTGDLRRIGLRASVVRTVEGSEVIVPNGSLISEKVINWTLSDQQRRLEIRVGVAYGTEPERVLSLLAEVAASHPDVLEAPAPQALFEGFGPSALEFLLRAWTDRFDRWQLVRSELTVRVNAALRDAEIEIPFPQRELRLRAVAHDAVEVLERAGFDIVKGATGEHAE